MAAHPARRTGANGAHRKLAPVDLAQAAIGPGMAVFSRYAKVIESDGAPMTVRTALGIINQTLDEVLDALELGFATTILADGIAAVELQSGDGERALAELRGAGAKVEDSIDEAGLDS